MKERTNATERIAAARDSTVGIRDLIDIINPISYVNFERIKNKGLEPKYH